MRFSDMWKLEQIINGVKTYSCINSKLTFLDKNGQLYPAESVLLVDREGQDSKSIYLIVEKASIKNGCVNLWNVLCENVVVI